MALVPLHAGDALPKPLKVQGVESIHDLRYLPDWRYSGDPSARRDYELLLNLYLPTEKGDRPAPMVMFVHGGAYSEGSKDDGYQREIIESFTRSGMAVATLNYIMLNKGIFPQVFWDFEDAARYLRMNAERYHLDPTAFGAIGISAGGWLIATAGHANGETFIRSINNGMRLGDKRMSQFGDAHPGSGEESFLRPILSGEPAYPGTYGRFQAMAFDFSQMNNAANGFTPAILECVGQDFTPGHLAAFQAAGVDWTPAVLTHPYHLRRQVHVPKLTNGGHEKERSIARTLDGSGETQLLDVMRDWFLRELAGPQARTPVPEIWPGQRLVAGPVQASMLVPANAIQVRYTTDGSEPGPGSTVYSKPFTVPPGTRVRAMASMPGRRASRVVEAHFRQGPLPPVITAPLDRELPPASTGKPYTVQFSAAGENLRWNVQGDLRPFVSGKSKTLYYPNGMMMDGTGRWSGTPTTPGTYWVQVWVNDGPGRIAGHRNYRWTVSGAPIGPQRPEEALRGDTHVPLATLGGWRDEAVAELRDRLQAAGIRAVFQDGAERQVMLLVPAADRDKAGAVLSGTTPPKGSTLEWAK
jgi:hypothetical protein